MKLIDCFMYFDEDLVLDIRLNTLYDKVDRFIIVEATKNHAGEDKELNFKIENFSKFKSKIDYIIIDDLPKIVKSPKKGWHENHARDQFQRNAIERGYKNYDDNDLIMISDIDEIPNPKKLGKFNVKNKYACFLQKNFQSKLNLLNVSEVDWPGTKICQKKYLKTKEFTDINLIKKKISLGKDLFNRKIDYKKVNIDETFPEYIFKNKEMFKDWIL